MDPRVGPSASVGIHVVCPSWTCLGVHEESPDSKDTHTLCVGSHDEARYCTSTLVAWRATCISRGRPINARLDAHVTCYAWPRKEPRGYPQHATWATTIHETWASRTVRWSSTFMRLEAHISQHGAPRHALLGSHVLRPLESNCVHNMSPRATTKASTLIHNTPPLLPTTHDQLRPCATTIGIQLRPIVPTIPAHVYPLASMICVHVHPGESTT